MREYLLTSIENKVLKFFDEGWRNKDLYIIRVNGGSKSSLGTEVPMSINLEYDWDYGYGSDVSKFGFDESEMKYLNDVVKYGQVREFKINHKD